MTKQNTDIDSPLVKQFTSTILEGVDSQASAVSRAKSAVYAGIQCLTILGGVDDPEDGVEVIEECFKALGETFIKMHWRNERKKLGAIGKVAKA